MILRPGGDGDGGKADALKGTAEQTEGKSIATHYHLGTTGLYDAEGSGGVVKGETGTLEKTGQGAVKKQVFGSACNQSILSVSFRSFVELLCIHSSNCSGNSGSWFCAMIIFYMLYMVFCRNVLCKRIFRLGTFYSFPAE